MQKITVVLEDEPALELLQLAASLGPRSLEMVPHGEPERKAHKRKRANADAGIENTTSGKLILSLMKSHPVGTEIKNTTLQALFEENGLNANSASPAVSRMMASGFLERVKPGTWRITHKGEEMANG